MLGTPYTDDSRVGDMKARPNAQMLYTIIAVGLALGLWGRLILQLTRLQTARPQRPYDG